MHRRILCLVFLTSLLAPGPCLPTDEATEVEPVGGLQFKSSIELTVVNVNVHVTDKKGKPVLGLGKDDFRIYQDGGLREITHFQPFTRETFSSEPAAVVESPPEVAATDEEGLTLRPMYVVLYVDNENIDPLDRNRVLSAAYDFVHDALRPPVKMMVASYDKSLKIAQPFTDDPQLVVKGLRAQRRKTGGRAEMEQTVQRVMDEIARYQQDNTQGQIKNPQRLLDEIRAVADEQANSLAFTLQSLRSVVSMMAGLPGKKSVVYISNGLPMITGMEMMTAYTNTFQDSGAMSGISRFDQTRHFRALASAAAAQGISFYTIAAGGLEVLAGTSAEHQTAQDTSSIRAGHENLMDSMRYMASETGGQAIVNTNNFVDAFTQITDDHFTYYSLGYQLSMSGGDKVHRIKVELPNHRDSRVRFRRRYVEKNLETQVQDTVMTNLVFPIDENPHDVRLAMGDPTPASEDRWVAPVTISFPLKNMALLPEGDFFVGRAVLFIAANDSEGGQSDLVRQPHEIKVTQEEYTSLKNEPWVINTNLLMTTGSFTVSIGLMDQVTRQASFETIKTVIRGN